MKRMILIFLCMLLLTGCTSTKPADLTLTCDELANQIQKAASFAELTDANVNYMEKYLMIDAADLESWVMRRDASRVTPEMILVLKVKEGADQAAIKTAVQEYHQEQLLQYRDYQPAQVFKLEEAKVMQQGNFVVLIVSPEAAKTNAALGTGWK